MTILVGSMVTALLVLRLESCLRLSLAKNKVFTENRLLRVIDFLVLAALFGISKKVMLSERVHLLFLSFSAYSFVFLLYYYLKSFKTLAIKEMTINEYRHFFQHTIHFSLFGVAELIFSMQSHISNWTNVDRITVYGLGFLVGCILLISLNLLLRKYYFNGKI